MDLLKSSNASQEQHYQGMMTTMRIQHAQEVEGLTKTLHDLQNLVHFAFIH